MHMKKLLLIFIAILLFSGCNSNRQVSELETQIVALESQNQTLVTDLKDAQNKMNQLESELKNKTSNPSRKELEVISASDDTLWYKINDIDRIYQTVSIIGYNIEGPNEEFSNIKLKGVGKGELFKVKVLGSIYDFELVELQWNSNTNQLDEVKVLKKFDEVRNQNIIIETTLSEGIPGEKIKWKDPNGNVYECFLSYDGYGFDGSILWNK